MKGSESDSNKEQAVSGHRLLANDNSPVAKPEEWEIARAAGQLSVILRREIDKLAIELINESARRKGQPEPIGLKQPSRRVRVALELTKLRIRHTAHVELVEAVVAARQAGATWAAIGLACGVSRQAAHDRWGKLLHATDEAKPAPFKDAIEHFLA
ncbi:hypothetical protein ABIA39_007758 [Nocardia sp. GAS34]|uniref:hypothetical protein n=1 Tax=unclassified Nocardia TaxID=2637762 RepID=UPI003D23B682